MRMNPYLSVIVPAYNEEKRISKTLGAIHHYLLEQPFEWEILIVLDGPNDHTLSEVEGFARGKDNIRWIDRKVNKGKGYSVREGMLAAHGSIRLFMDADNSTDISHFDKMKPLFEKGNDIIICSRDEKDAEGAKQVVSQPIYKRLIGNMGNLFIQLVAVPGIWDTQCGFKAVRAPAAEKIFSVAKIDRWGFDIEVLALARHFGFTIGIVPAQWIDDAASHVTLGGYLGVFFQTLQIRWNLIIKTYDRAS
ncbi:MAG: Glycosyl transferase family protein [Parcubacteria group bacterium GW2011_GWA2_47_10b]|nr:MAG: Glycosyl transferase family protein [Parcubacteria group bacterium GW2011_GWA2_47_10b]KKU86101.1 MAG: Glycosyl transferase family protein [Parcubacteria group bacterium GW2011_GWA1_47_9]